VLWVAGAPVRQRRSALIWRAGGVVQMDVVLWVAGTPVGQRRSTLVRRAGGVVHLAFALGLGFGLGFGGSSTFFLAFGLGLARGLGAAFFGSSSSPLSAGLGLGLWHSVLGLVPLRPHRGLWAWLSSWVCRPSFSSSMDLDFLVISRSLLASEAVAFAQGARVRGGHLEILI